MGLASLMLLVPLALGCTMTTVPVLKGETREQAQDTLERTGLRLGAVRYDDNANGRPGAVLEQDPEAGTPSLFVTRVDVVIVGPRAAIRPSEPPPAEPAAAPARPAEYAPAVPDASVVPTRMPDLRGLEQETAVEWLRGVGFAVRTSPVAERGDVIAQAPRPGKVVHPGTLVRLEVVSTNPTGEIVTVPDVRGTPRDVGIQVLRDSGFWVGSPVAPRNAVVVGESPKPGSRVERGSTVMIELEAVGAR